jgi:hypothetical protein
MFIKLLVLMVQVTHPHSFHSKFIFFVGSFLAGESTTTDGAGRGALLLLIFCRRVKGYCLQKVARISCKPVVTLILEGFDQHNSG